MFLFLMTIITQAMLQGVADWEGLKKGAYMTTRKRVALFPRSLMLILCLNLMFCLFFYSHLILSILQNLVVCKYATACCVLGNHMMDQYSWQHYQQFPFNSYFSQCYQWSVHLENFDSNIFQSFEIINFLIMAWDQIAYIVLRELICFTCILFLPFSFIVIWNDLA